MMYLCLTDYRSTKIWEGACPNIPFQRSDDGKLFYILLTQRNGLDVCTINIEDARNYLPLLCATRSKTATNKNQTIDVATCWLKVIHQSCDIMIN